MRNLLGGKGANLAEMNLIGVPVPPGFTITTDVCNEYFAKGKADVVGLLKDDVENSVRHIENLMGSKFGDPTNPLLVSVRSGARASMPGMMDTILNLGLNDEVVVGLAKKTNNERFAYDSYRRFVQMYGDVVLGMKPENKEDIDPFYGAPTVIVVLSDRNIPTHVEDGSLVLGNLMNAAHALGLGSCWINRAKVVFEMTEAREILRNAGIGDEYIGVGHCLLGYADGPEKPASPRKSDYVVRV